MRSCEAAERKSVALLGEWLSSAQLSKDKDQIFETRGSKAGKRRRTKQGNQQNVFELNETAQPVRVVYFARGFLASGDVMLAQKVPLETVRDRLILRTEPATNNVND